MTIQFKTNTVYTLSSRGLVFKLECTYIEDNTVWFTNTIPSSHSFDANGPYTTKELVECYKLERKTNKLYVFNTKYQSYDLVENTLSEDKVEDVWQARSTHRYASAYDGSDHTLNEDD